MKVKFIYKSQFNIKNLNKEDQYFIIDSKDIIYFKPDFGWKMLNSKVLSDKLWFDLIKYARKFGAITKESKFDLQFYLTSDPQDEEMVDSFLLSI